MTVLTPRTRDMIADWLTERRWSEQEYLLFAGDQNALIELSDGKVVIHEMPTPQHQSIVLNLAADLRRVTTGKVFVAPMPVQLWPGKMREPDLVFFRVEHLERVGEQYAGLPDLVVEVLSPFTRAIDLGDKMDEYAAAGIPEYWVVEPDAQNVSIYALSGTAFHLAARFRSGEQVQSPSFPELAVAVDEVFA